MVLAAHLDDRPREQEQPEHRQACEDSAERGLAHGLPHVGGIERHRHEEGERSVGAWGLQEVCEHGRRYAPEGQPPLRHVVHGEVVVGPEVEGRPETRRVVPHKKSRYRQIRYHKSGCIPSVRFPSFFLF